MRTPRLPADAGTSPKPSRVVSRGLKWFRALKRDRMAYVAADRALADIEKRVTSALEAAREAEDAPLKRAFAEAGALYRASREPVAGAFDLDAEPRPMEIMEKYSHELAKLGLIPAARLLELRVAAYARAVTVRGQVYDDLRYFTAREEEERLSDAVSAIEDDILEHVGADPDELALGVLCEWRDREIGIGTGRHIPENNVPFFTGLLRALRSRLSAEIAAAVDVAIAEGRPYAAFDGGAQRNTGKP